jgi:exodeoxyribonuclease X
MNILFLDTETTGFEEGRIIQLAYKDKGSKDILVEYYKPPVPIEFGAMGVHHITEKMVADKLPFSETDTYKKLPQILSDSILVAHNAKFDIGILKTEGIDTLNHICTYKVAYSLYDYPDHKLQSLRYRWGIEIDEARAHDASGDVLVLEEVFNYMLSDYMSKNQKTEEETIKKFIEISMTPQLLRSINFGKSRGMSFDEIRQNDFSYLEWLAKLPDKDEDFVFTVKYHIEKGVQKEETPF